MDEEAIRAAFYECKEIPEVEGGEYDDDGFYRLPDGDFYDPDGIYFNKEGKDEYGGSYDKDLNYIPGEEYESVVKEIARDHHLLEAFGVEGGDDFPQEGEEDLEQLEEFQEKDDEQMKEYLMKEKIDPKARFLMVSFTGMSPNKEDEKAYQDWFKERGVKPIDIAINNSRLNIRLKIDDMESILNAVKLDGTPDVDYIKVHIPNIKQEKVVIAEGEGEGEGEEEKEAEKPKGTKLEVEGAEDDGFEITTGV